MQIETTFPAIMEKIKDGSVGDDVEKREPLHTVQKNVNLYSHYGKEYEGSSKI